MSDIRVRPLILVTYGDKEEHRVKIKEALDAGYEWLDNSVNVISENMNFPAFRSTPQLVFTTFMSIQEEIPAPDQQQREKEEDLWRTDDTGVIGDPDDKPKPKQ